MDIGESEAIVLSDTLSSSMLLMDEAKGRQVAMQMGIPIMGTIGIFLAAHREKLLSKKEILECIEIFKSVGRHISEKLFEQLKSKLSD